MRKVLLIGIDAMDPKVTDKLMSEGKLPNFQRLKAAGSYSELGTTIPPETPVAWSAAATGSNPGKYNIYDFINRDPATYLPKLNLAREKRGLLSTEYESALKGVPFWRITTDAGIPTTVIRWPVTFPPEKVNGRMLSGLGVVDIKGMLNSYSFYTSEQYDPGSEGADKVVPVEIQDDTIRATLKGPMTRKGGGITEIEIPMDIRISDKENAIISVGGSEYPIKVNGWSSWMKAKFKIGLMKNISGIFRAYLLSLDPFNMYVTSVQIDPTSPLVDITYPKEYGKELVDSIGLFYTLGMTEDTKAVTEKRIGKEVLFQQIEHIEQERERMFWHEFNKFKEGVLAFGFDAGDRLCHIFWENKVLSGSPEFRVSKEIEKYYLDKDRFLGQVLEKIDNDTALIIFSDHGFNSFEKAVSINTWLARNGYMTLTGEPDEKNSGGLFEFVDWSRTRAYSLGFASIYVNLQGREARGIVKPEDKESLVAEIMAKLKGFTDLGTGSKVLTEAYIGKDIYKGRFINEAPDIIIGFGPGYRMSWQNAVGGLTKEIILDNDQEWKGDHLIDKSHVPGVIFTNIKIKKQNPQLIDICPTILHLLGLGIPEEIDGGNLI